LESHKVVDCSRVEETFVCVEMDSFQTICEEDKQYVIMFLGEIAFFPFSTRLSVDSFQKELLE